MTGPDLVRRIRAVLRELSLLPEGRAISYEGDRVQGGASKSAPPPGYGRDLRETSLYAYWHKRFADSKGQVSKLQLYVYLAERDLDRHRHGVKRRDPHEPASERQLRIVNEYEGLSDLEASIAEDCDQIIIRVARAAHERDPFDGYAYADAG